MTSSRNRSTPSISPTWPRAPSTAARLVLENRLLRAVAGKRDDIEARLPGRTQAMVDLRYRLRAVAATDADMLIIGDTGTGKEVAARALHDISAARPRSPSSRSIAPRCPQT